VRVRWSVTGATPYRPPSFALKRARRRNSEPIPSSKPWLAATPASSRGKMRATDLEMATLGTPARSLTMTMNEAYDKMAGRALSPVLGSAAGSCAIGQTRSPLSYFGLKPQPPSSPPPFSLHDDQDGSGTGLKDAFEREAGGLGKRLSLTELQRLGVECLDLPKAIARLLAKRAQQEMPAEEQDGTVSYGAFSRLASHLRRSEQDKIRVFRVLRRPGSLWLTPSDIEELVWAVAESHAGLDFLRSSDEFLKAYVETTTLRILWNLGGFGTRRIDLQHWRHSTVTEVLYQLDEEQDINLARDFFSYNHFYVIWCIFWELDEDEDSILQKDDVMRYGSYGLSSRVVDRLWHLRRHTDSEGMKYADFVFFLLAEEDKQSLSALQYWFHVLDVNCDGVLDTQEMWYFYEELQSRLEAMGEEVVPFDEIVNEFNDMVAPARPSRITLSELKRCGLGYNVVSALTNVRKYIAWEGLSCEKAAGRASNLRDSTDWDLFADREYRRLVDAEEDEDDGEERGDSSDS